MNSPITKIGLILKRHDPRVRQVVTEAIPWLRERGVAVFLDRSLRDEFSVPAEAVDPADFGRIVDLVAVFGGDGTFLYAARLVAGSEKPVLGVNLGALGFLTEVKLEDMRAAFGGVLSGNYTIEERMLLEAEVFRQDQPLVRYMALNDGVITKGTLARIIDLEVRVNSELVTRTRADGLIVSTPTGSTAYSLAAGGPILYPTLAALIITPICPHTLTNRPVVVPDGASVSVWLRHGSDVMLTIDGQVGTPLAPNDRIVFRKGERSLRLVQLAGSTFFRLLREKLKWG
ncbi:MAG: NAD(+)/NADH kinase [Acidobacteriota bacterium]